MKKQVRQEGEEKTVKEGGKKKKQQDFKKKNIVNSTRGSWQYKEEEGNVLSTRGQDKRGKDLGKTSRRYSSESDCKQLIQ